MKKLLAVLLTLVLALGIFSVAAPEQAKAASESSTDAKKVKATLYKGQTKLVWMTYDGKAVPVKWKITSGKKNIKISKDNVYVTGKKKGKSVITASYGGQKVEITITVKKAPSSKQKNIKVDGTVIAVPKGFLVDALESDQANLASVKDETLITIASLKELDKDEIQVFYNNYYSYMIEEFGTQLTNMGFVIDSYGMSYKDGFGYTEIKLSSPAISFFISYDVLNINGDDFIVNAYSYDKKNLKSAFTSFKELNNGSGKTGTITTEDPFKDTEKDTKKDDKKDNKKDTAVTSNYVVGTKAVAEKPSDYIREDKGVYYVYLGNKEVGIKPNTAWETRSYSMLFVTYPNNDTKLEFSNSLIDIGNTDRINRMVEGLGGDYKNIKCEKFDIDGAKEQSYIVTYKTDYSTYAILYLAGEGCGQYLEVDISDYKGTSVNSYVEQFRVNF